MLVLAAGCLLNFGYTTGCPFFIITCPFARQALVQQSLLVT